MSGFAKILVGLTIATYFAFFLIEAVLWTWPPVYALLLPQLNWGLDYPGEQQARVLRNLFINQGVYNLMLGLAGVAGFALIRRGKVEAGRALIDFICVFALGAAAILLATTHAYALGILQAVFPALALVLLHSHRSSET